MLKIVPDYVDVAVRKRVEELRAEDPSIDPNAAHKDILNAVMDGRIPTLDMLQHVTLKPMPDRSGR